MNALRTFASDVLGTLHNLWVALPLGIQAALAMIAFAVWQFAIGYNWQIPAGFDLLVPATWALLVTPVSAFAVALWAILYPLITTKLWPQLVPHLLDVLQLVVSRDSLGPTNIVHSSSAGRMTLRHSPRPVEIWTKGP
jgi:hypothetical protein